MPVRFVVPAPLWMNAPVPLIAPLITCVLPTRLFAFTVPAFAMLPTSVRLFARFTPSVAPPRTLIWPDVMLPLVPLPTCSVPAFTFVAPE